MMQLMKKQWKPILFSLLAYIIWAVTILTILVILKGEHTTRRLMEINYPILYTNLPHIINVLLKGIVVYYILIYLLIIPLIKTKNWKKVGLQSLLFFLALAGYEYFSYFDIISQGFVEIDSTSIYLLLNIICLNISKIFIALFFAMIITSYEINKNKQELEKQKLEAEISAIKYQINPHFLFNSLSFIYTKTIKINPEAAHAVLLLSEIMSYALDEWDELGKVPLALEVEHMKKVIEMNQIRFNHNLNIKYSEHIEANDAYIPTLAFITLVENAFKHGDLNDKDNHITIHLEATKNKIYFLVSNKKKKGPKEPSKGIGLSNVQQRLQLMYGSKYSFTIKEDENYYINEITINL